MLAKYHFFDYKDFIEGYNGEDFMGIFNILLLVLGLIAIVLLCVFLKNTKKDNITTYLKIIAIVMPLLEIIKIVWESYWDIKMGHGFNWSGLLPLYTCSLFMFTLPFAAFGKGKVKEYALSFLTTICIFGGLTNFVMLNILKSYPFWTFASFMSINYHFLMVFTGIFLVVSGYYRPNWSDIIKGWIPVVLFSVIVIPVNFIIYKYNSPWVDYMLYMRGYNLLFLGDLSDFFFSHNLGLIFSLIMMCGYILISALIVSIQKLIFYIINFFKNKIKE